MSAILEAQLAAQAEADQEWLRQKLKHRYGGLEDRGPGDPAQRWDAVIWRSVEKAIPFTYPPRFQSVLVRTWFTGPTIEAALRKARAWVEEQFAKKGVRT